MKLTEIIANGIKKINARRSADSLGDRTQYIGASDLGQCPRKAVLSKIMEQEHSLKTLLNFERGHISEDLVDAALIEEGFRTNRQVELAGETKNGTPLKFHLDFVFETKDRFAICEAKSPSPVPSAPWESWELQLYAQMGLAKELYPDKEVSGTIYAIDLAPKNSEEMQGWNGYAPSIDLWESLKEDADILYGAVQEYKETGNLPDLPLTPSPLCGFCPGLGSCPIFQGEQAEELAPQLQELLAIQEAKKKLEAQEKALKNHWKTMLAPKKGTWLTIPVSDKERKVQLREKTSQRVDYKSLNKTLEEMGVNLDDFRTPSTYEELSIK